MGNILISEDERDACGAEMRTDSTDHAIYVAFPSLTFQYLSILTIVRVCEGVSI